MKKTISLKLKTTSEQAISLFDLQSSFVDACNQIVPVAKDNRCWNRVALHHLSYYDVRESSPLGSQMVCNAIKVVCDSYKTWVANNPKKPLPTIAFKPTSSVHFDKRTYSIKGETLSLYTLDGRIKATIVLGEFQRDYLNKGVLKEAELIRKKKKWFFNLVLDLPDTPKVEPTGKILGIDLGENVIAASSSGKLFDGAKLRHDRDKALALRSRLQSNGSKSSKQLLNKVSGKEARHVKHVNHVISKAIVQEAVDQGCDVIAMEDLTNIRKRIKARKRVRSRLHRWSWAQLQCFVEYKAEDAGLSVVYVNPAYTSKTCSECGQLGSRNKHKFSCKRCGIQRHSDLNASQNIRKIALSADNATGVVTRPNVDVA